MFGCDRIHNQIHIFPIKILGHLRIRDDFTNENQIFLLSAPLQRVRMQSLFSVAITLLLLISCMAHVASGTDAEKDLKLPGAKSPGPLERLTAKKTPKPTRKPTGKPIIKTAKPSFRDPGHSCLYNPWVLGC